MDSLTAAGLVALAAAAIWLGICLAEQDAARRAALVPIATDGRMDFNTYIVLLHASRNARVEDSVDMD